MNSMLFRLRGERKRGVEVLKLETASKLKSAGLKWEPQKGDWYYNHHDYVFGTTTTLDLLNEVTVLIHSIARDYVNRTVHFAPRLDQLLVEVEKRDWEIDLQFFNNGTGWFCEVAKTVQFRHNKPRPKLTINNKDGTTKEVEPISTCPGWGDYGEKRMYKEFTAYSPEEAAALGLLWIIEQEARD